MDQVSPELRAALDTAKDRIKVDSYYTRSLNSSFKGRTQGLWSGTVLGMFGGAIIGGATSLALLVAGVTTGPIGALIGVKLILGLASVGAGVGGAGGMLIGAPAGAVAGAMAEKERREKAEKLEQEVLASPEKQREVIEAYRQDPVVEKDDTVGQNLATTRDQGKAWGRIIDLKTMLFASAICAAVGIAVCVGGFLLAGGAAAVAASGPISMGFGMLTMNSLGGAVLMGAALGGGMGSLFGFNFPMIYTSLCEKAADILSGKTVRGETQFGHIKTVPEIEAEAAQNRNSSTPLTMSQSQSQPLPHIHDAMALDRVSAQARELSA